MHHINRKRTRIVMVSSTAPPTTSTMVTLVPLSSSSSSSSSARMILLVSMIFVCSILSSCTYQTTMMVSAFLPHNSCSRRNNNVISSSTTTSTTTTQRFVTSASKPRTSSSKSKIDITQSKNMNKKKKKQILQKQQQVNRNNSENENGDNDHNNNNMEEKKKIISSVSPRLQKAKLLLGQLTIDEEEEESLNMGSSVSSSTSTSSSSSSKNANKNKNRGKKQKDKKVIKDNDDTDTVVVPDNQWSNGLLDGSDVVTRYAFRQGIKIAEPLVKYDPIKAEKMLFKQPDRWLIRNIEIAVPLGWWAVGVVQDYFLFDGGGNNNNGDDTTIDTKQLVASAKRRKKRAIQLRKAISNLGPAIIKAGQALSSRPDLLPLEYLDELQKLQDDVPRFSNKLAFATVEEELGVQSFDDVFELEFEEPIAAASIGQVYKGRLKANGDMVAIKIQRPNCEEIIALDLYILRWWSGIYNKIFQFLNRDINVQSIIDDFGELIYREIDYVAEAANAQRFNELYASVAEEVFVPKVYSDLTTRKVLVMEWVDGSRLTDSAYLDKYDLDRSKLIDTLVQSSIRQILENGFFHADPHGGNLLACPDGRLCYLDFGMMSYVDRTQRNGFLLAVVHIVNRDWAELIKVYQRLGFIPVEEDSKPIEIALEKALPDVLNADISELNFKNVVNKLGDIFYTFPFSLPPFYIAIIRCLGVLEGLAIQVDPTSRIISEAYPYVASRVLTDPQQDLQEALKRLALTSDGRVRWNRLEGLLDEAQGSSGYDVSAALNLLTDYLISDEGDAVLSDLADEIVHEADSLGTDGLSYLVKAIQAIAINDDISTVNAFRSLQSVISQEKGLSDEVKGVLPKPTESMMRFSKILSLLNVGADTDYSKIVPIIRKLAVEPKIQRKSNEITARLGERALSRSLRSLFGLPPPTFDGPSSTVFEEKEIN